MPAAPGLIPAPGATPNMPGPIQIVPPEQKIDGCNHEQGGPNAGEKTQLISPMKMIIRLRDMGVTLPGEPGEHQTIDNGI